GLLSIDIRDQLTAIASGIAPADEWRKYLGYFSHLMQAGTADAPRAKLRIQRRMHPDIAGVVATFYDRDLLTHDEAQRNHGLQVLPFAGTALVWLDTSGLGVNAHERNHAGLCNHSEAAVLKYYFRRQAGEVRRFEDDVAPLAVLSPYRGQVRLLRERLGYDDSVVRTVDGFQGGQAEIVLVSLVRNNASDVPDKAIGFLRDPSRVNVMFSRARRLLVIVGNLAHFEQHGRGTFWDGVLGYVRGDRRYVFDVAANGFRFPENRP
ncbi:MAG: C-terminal helicase domain-containing protein, partial [bacterium]